MPTNDQSAVQTVGLTKTFKDFWHRQRVVAVDHLDLDIHHHEVFGLLGPNGSGKTTTIKILLGLLYPTRGRIRVLNRAPTDVAIKERIGYLPEESYLYQFLNARETLDYYGQLFRIPRQDRRKRVDQLLEMVGLTRDARRRVGEYSKGMARRIGLAQALINDPDLLILDEPTTGLDPIGTREIKDLIIFLNREKKKTILLCSHLLADVEDVCQRVVVLFGGRQQAIGNIHDLLSRQNLTQITTDRLSEQTIDRIRELVESVEQKKVVSVSTPTDKLETFFLRIVRQAQEIRQRTSGVTSGGQIADFLASAEPQGKEVVESLISAATRPVPAELTQPVPVEPVEQKALEVVGDLISAASESSAEPSEQEKQAPAPPPESEQADQQIIENLVKRANPKDNQQ